MKKSSEILDRDREWRVLSAAWASKRPELLVLVGRRRVGKSFLLARFARAHHGLYYQATRKTGAEQLRALARAAGEQLGEAALAGGAAFLDWESFLRWIMARAKERPFLLVLDELPYLVEAEPALPSILQAAWDSRAEETRLKLVLSGSYFSAMERLTSVDAPLFGRRTHQLVVRPFTYLEAARFLPKHAPRDQLVAYGAFGGLPGNLALLDSGRSVEENIIAGIFEPSARLFEEGGQLLDPLLKDTAVHYSIIDAVADGEHTWSKIANRVGRKASSLSRPLAWLMDMQLLERVLPITSRPVPHSKEAVYRLADPYLRFWHSTVSPVMSSGAGRLLQASELWRRFGAPALDRHMGSVFKQACRDFVSSSSRMPFQPIRVGEWWDIQAQNQVDLVAQGGDGELLVAECKWGALQPEDLSTLERRADTIVRQLGSVRHVMLALFAAGGPRNRELERRVRSGGVLTFGLDELY